MERNHSDKILVTLGAGQFILSAVLLLIASTSKKPLPMLAGVVDVGLVLALVLTLARL